MLNHIATKAKAYAALCGAVLTALAGVYTDKPLTAAAAVVTALAVYRVPNAD